MSRTGMVLLAILFLVSTLVAQEETKPLGKIWTSVEQVPISGDANRLTLPLDQMMTSFLLEHQIPGATLTVTRKGRLVYSRGFGYSDIETATAMPADARMRLASISKPITAVAIMQLVDQGKLKLYDKVIPYLELETVDGEGPVDPRMNEITVLHLLRHTGGFDRDKSFDPMFIQNRVAEYVGKKVPVGPKDIISFMLSQELDFAPGERYAYSNFGYSLLGRVIEKQSGLSYEEFVQANVLKPLEIESMAIGKTRFSERMDGEPRYYTRKGEMVGSVVDQYKKNVPSPYGRWYLESFDSHGGWISSGEDLVRFASAFDNIDRSPILSRKAITLMFNPPDLGDIPAASNGVKRFYSCGWSMVLFSEGKRFNSFHGGLFSGSSTFLVRRHDGFNWAVLFNTDKTEGGKQPSSEIDSLIHRAVDSVKRWPR